MSALHEFPPSPPLTAPYEQVRACEAATEAYIAAHGPSAEALYQLAMLAANRCAYRRSVAWSAELVRLYPEMGHPVSGLNSRILLIQSALHCCDHETAAAVVREFAASPEIVQVGIAEIIAKLFRGTGLQPEMHALLSRCQEIMPPGTPLAETVGVLVREYAEATQLAESVRLISLGSGCYPWLQLNRYMLRKVSPQDVLLPFNLNVIAETSIVTALEDRFSAFGDPAEFTSSPIVRNIPMARHRRYGLLLNHDCDDDQLDDGMVKLAALSVRRAETFLDVAMQGPRVLLCMLGDFRHVPQIEAAVGRLARDGEYRLLFVAGQHGRLSPPDPPALPTTRLVHVPVPVPGYNWAVSEHTPEGYSYDLAVRRAALDAMRDLVGA